MSEYSYDKAPTNPHHGGKMTPTDMVRYIEELETRLRSLLLEHISDLAQAQEAYEQVVELEAEVKHLRKALEIYERERNRYKHAEPEMSGAYFLAGGHGPKDDNQMPQFVEIVPAYGCGWSMVYEDTGRTISYEGL